MRTEARDVAAAVALSATFASIAYTALAISRLRVHARRPRTRPSGRPAITILKPVRGVEPGLAENLRSFCAQDYPEFEVVFGVLDPADPALPIVRRVAADYPDRTTVVVGDGIAEHRNPKIATLAPMVPHAKHALLVISDSDMRVTPDYLDAIATAFADDGVGAATCIYRGEPADDGLASRLGAMWIGEQFAPSALVAAAVEPLTYCFGATMAIRRDAFAAIGGLRGLGTQLADDHTLGRLVTEQGFRVALARCVVANVVSESGVRELLLHELRWARTIRTVRPRSYYGIVLTYPLPLALLYAVLTKDRGRVIPVLALAGLARLALHREAHRALGTRAYPSPLLIPLRDAFGIAVWIGGLAGRDVRWRDAAFRVAANGILAPLPD